MGIFESIEIDKLREEIARLRLAIVWMAKSHPLQKHIGGAEALEVIGATEIEQKAVEDAIKKHPDHP